MMPTIQIWDSFAAIPIEAEPAKNDLQIEVYDPARSLPEALEKKVDANWEQTCQKNSQAQDNYVLYLAVPTIEEDGKTKIITEARRFRYTAAFNRNTDFHNLTNELKLYRLLSISTHCHLVTKDGKILFGTKKNQFNQISGFSGFPNAVEDTIKIKGVNCLDIYKTIQNRLRPEIGYLVDAVDSIKATGITYVDAVGLRGTDSDYLVRLDETADRAVQRFQESCQFQKNLYAVDFEPGKMIDFVKTIHADGKVMSRYALGCMYLEMKACFSQPEADKLLNVIRKDVGVNIATTNQTDYFKL